ncbi:camphor resistance protein CrcB [Selenomonas ruminantium]|uniref:Fluoride-specific ion channel FluC n=1 Tax=Selenomonas ruminantium TaxID=971 RepID=A0A1I3BT30_SELRU|nr:fluoride efflux transporter CrcB [Selenomonas ruminantium]SFH65330.1 camphor resistance protein CrcB [Selenomonas ruminantium]
MAYFYVFIGGGLGAVCRYGVTTTVGMLLGGMFPWGTLVVNLVGSLLMGLVIGALLPLAKSLQLLPESLRLLLTVGFLGGFTTFSSFSMETLTLLRGDSFFLAAVNVVGSIVLGLAAAYIGYQLAMVFQR